MLETTTQTPTINQQFLTDVLSGLSANKKFISSKYFYDRKGDEIFQQIMHMDEYYLTNAEYEIFNTFKSEIGRHFVQDGRPFNLIEFGAGDGYKTKVLLKEFIAQGLPFKYVPIDISQNALDGLESTLKNEIPELKFRGRQGDYFEVLQTLGAQSTSRNVVLFLGSNIGNFTNDEAHAFLSGINNQLNTDDLVLMGLDIKKDPEKILLAYNDPKGITASFNYNLLNRINRELDGNFEPTQFLHYPTYDPVTGECKSALLSKIKQDVIVAGQTFHFETWEPIHTEISRKYALSEIHQLGEDCGFDSIRDFSDQNHYFIDTLWRVI